MGKLKQEVSTIVGYLLFGGVAVYGDALIPTALPGYLAALVFVLLFTVMLWLAFSVVRHAECLAELLGEPYGTLILTLSVIGIEVALISSVMITGADRPTLARDTMFSVVMIVLNGLVGLSLVTGGLKHRFQDYNLKGANAYLAVLIPLAVLTLVLPRFSHSAPGGEMSLLQAGFFIVMSLLLYGVFLAIQTVTHTDMFKFPTQINAEGQVEDGGHHSLVVHSIPFHAFALIAAMLPIVLLSKKMAIYVEFGIEFLGAPVALGGFLIAALVLTPEGLGAIKAARSNQLQRAVNICLGSALATIGLTVPAVLIIGMIMGSPVELGLIPVDIIVLLLTLVVSLVTFVSARTNFLLGAVHLSLFAAYVMMIFDGK
ncbi:calcium:proton antiporter [Rhodovibrionaceae bacterium A322]